MGERGAGGGQGLRVRRPHYLAHFAAFAVLAFAWRRGLRGVPAWLVLLAVVAFGFAQEAIEVAGHAHPFELADALVDAAGALVGVVIARTTQRTRTSLAPDRDS